MYKKIISIIFAILLMMSVFTSALAAPTPTPTPKPVAKTPTPAPKPTPAKTAEPLTAVSTDPNKPFYAHEANYIPGGYMTFALSQSLWNRIMKDTTNCRYITLATFKVGAPLNEQISSNSIFIRHDDFDTKYRNSVWMFAPTEPGTYEVILFDSEFIEYGWHRDALTQNAASVITRTKIVVRKNALNSFNFRLNKTEYCKYEYVRVELSGLTEQHHLDWAVVSINPVGDPVDKESSTETVRNYPNDVIYLLAPGEPGKYEVRGYFRASPYRTDADIVKKITFTVANKDLPPGPIAQGGGNIDTTIASKIIGKWSSSKGVFSSTVYESVNGILTSEPNFTGYIVNFDPDGSYYKISIFSGAYTGMVGFMTKGTWSVDKEILRIKNVTQSATYLRNSDSNYVDKPMSDESYNVTVQMNNVSGSMVLDTYGRDILSPHTKYLPVD